jgi:hypothetical protein
MSGSIDEREYKRSEDGARGFFILVLKLTGTELSTVRTNRNPHGRQYACGVILLDGARRAEFSADGSRIYSRDVRPFGDLPFLVGSGEKVVLVLIGAGFVLLAAANTLRARAPLPKAAITLRIFFIELASGSKAMTLNPGLSTTENVM